MSTSSTTTAMAATLVTTMAATTSSGDSKNRKAKPILPPPITVDFSNDDEINFDTYEVDPPARSVQITIVASQLPLNVIALGQAKCDNNRGMIS